ncbi:sigma 54-interacting transcriptional regulator [Desmospora profundinema]|uniref:Transcriptional regulator with AAA-type ATPase domain n=1 Tax=Desmospora profundinema TaxID=1571184 RepID=A0ABU1INL4_9BACL|nr:sigma 54-interacting transcriptional regulator [Desmospora profundinema]MDR6225759.1 transcriptional regulator with AAA-type ATPase domain [Desmospora profundinema]
MKRLDQVRQLLAEHSASDRIGMTAREVGQVLKLDRSTVSRYLNRLVKETEVEKLPGRPVRFRSVQPPLSQPVEEWVYSPQDRPGSLIGNETEMKEALAALLYPPRGLPLLLEGETGTGKTHLVEQVVHQAREQGKIRSTQPFVTFNCSEYAQNPELLMGQLFGIRKGAFTGAASDRTGLVERADGGILFLDEIHRLPPVGQEMLFHLIDQGVYRRLGEAELERQASIRLIGATTERPDQVLLPTLLRRFAVKLTLPSLGQRERREREKLVDAFFIEEARHMALDIRLDFRCRQAFLEYSCPGNIGQLKGDVQHACAQAFLRHLYEPSPSVTIRREDLPAAVSRVWRASALASPPFPSTLTDGGEKTVYSELLRKEQELSARGWSRHERIRELKQMASQYLKRSAHPADDRRQTGGEQLQEVISHLTRPLTEGQQEALESLIRSLTIEGDQPSRPFPETESLPEEHRKAAHSLAQAVTDQGFSLPEEAWKEIAHLLSAFHESESASAEGVPVLIVTHGESTATSMAQVANALLGDERVHAVDMPLDQPASIALQRVSNRVASLHRGNGILLLVDIGSLTTMGEDISREHGISIHTLSDVTLSMVIHAARKAQTPGWDAQRLMESVRDRFPAPVSTLSPTQRRRVVGVVCPQGEGSIPALKDWVKNNLENKEIDVLSGEWNPHQSDSFDQVLHEWHQSGEIIALVGTHSPPNGNIPFFHAWELLQPDGIRRWKEQLAKTGSPS